jgi:hypothetical protein
MLRISQRPRGEKLAGCVAKFPPFRNTQNSGGNLAAQLLITTRMSKISVAAPRQGAAPLYDPFVHITVGTVKRSSQSFSNFFQVADLGLPLTDASLKDLKQLKRLEALYLSNTQVSDAGLPDLAELKGLKTLYLSRTNVTDAGVARLQASLPKCKIIQTEKGK